ncbi:hypothetical protein GCM10017774_73020 [Lentzea cavernae]|uniref:Uncharacterized protein n=2 Tax=Lentzea cavernae TaxID=2020703 RepID=A0ABQ3MQD9_9PSEU|nr:hypothetical protein GCM10017774_73020 [Lentzea cavernae]
MPPVCTRAHGQLSHSLEMCSYVLAFERPRNTVLAVDAFLIAVPIRAVDGPEVIPGTVAVFNAYKVNAYGGLTA